MPESPERLLQRIRLGEDSSIAFKTVTPAADGIQTPEPDELADALAAFANARGGTLVLGVDETRQIVGIPPEQQDTLERYVAEIVRDAIDPPLYPDIYWCELPDAGGHPRPVLRVEIPQSLFVHKGPGGYLRRVGSSQRRLEPEYLDRLFLQRIQERLIRFDELFVPGASFEDLDPALVDRFRTPRAPHDREALAHQLAIARPNEDGDMTPTVAGILLCARKPEDWLRSAFIQAVAYRGTSVPESLKFPYYQVDARDIFGPLDVQVADACHFVMKNQKVAARKRMGRVDLPQYDMTAVFEAVVNAVAHRDYSVRGSKIRLQMFEDRLELHAPGGLGGSLTVDTLEYRQATRNETIAALLGQCSVPPIVGLETPHETFMDRRGKGVATILDRSAEISGKEPEYRLFDEAELLLTIHAATPETGDSTHDPVEAPHSR